VNSRLRQQLVRDEGEVAHAYQDSLGYWTIGVGRLIDKRKGGSLSPDEIDYLLDNDIKRKSAEVMAALPWVAGLSPARQGVVLNMAFQMGTAGLLKFVTTLKLVQAGDYAGAARQMLRSLWARQTPERAKRLAKQMESGQWQ
jgi:lysozyme